MQRGPYILHARGGKLSRVPAEKTLLPRDPVANPHQVHAAMGADGTVYFSYGSTLSKSTDGGQTWSSHELTLEASQNCSFQVLRDGTFIGVRAEGPEDPSRVVCSQVLGLGLQQVLQVGKIGLYLSPEQLKKLLNRTNRSPR